MDNSLAVRSYHRRDQAHVRSYHHGDQAHCLYHSKTRGMAGSSCFYSAYRAEGSWLTLPQCQEDRSQERKDFQKGRDTCQHSQRELSIHEETVCLLQCSLFLYDQWLPSVASSELVWIEASLGLASCRKRTDQSKAFPFSAWGLVHITLVGSVSPQSVHYGLSHRESREQEEVKNRGLRRIFFFKNYSVDLICGFMFECSCNWDKTRALRYFV